jgi:uncharacterized protein (TIRG00374 family)
VTRSAAGWVLRLIVAAALTAYVLYRSEPRAVLGVAAGADLSFVAFALLLILVDRALMAFRWIALLCIVDNASRPPLRRLLAIFFVSTFLGTFLPASVGGDAVRAYSLSRDRVDGADAVASVFMDRMLGVASLLLMGVLGLWLARDLATNGAVVVSLLLTLAACGLTTTLIFSERVGAWAARMIATIVFTAICFLCSSPRWRSRCCACCRRTFSGGRSASPPGCRSTSPSSR